MKGAALYAAAIAAFLALAWLRTWDVDRGGYIDSFRTRDKVYHAAGCFASALAAALLLHVAPAIAAALTIAGGIGFELVQAHPRSGGAGYFSWRDVVADAIGAVLAAVTVSTLR